MEISYKSDPLIKKLKNKLMAKNKIDIPIEERQKYEKKILAIVIDEISNQNGDKISLETDLQEKLFFKDMQPDSLAWISILTKIEDEYDIDFDYSYSNEKLEKIKTVADLVNWTIEKKYAA